jgi:hypothetical protein
MWGAGALIPICTLDACGAQEPKDLIVTHPWCLFELAMSSLGGMVSSVLSGEMPFGGSTFTSVVIMVVVFFWWTWPAKFPKGVPGPCHNIPYFGAAFELLANINRLPDFCTEGTEIYHRTWGAPMPKVTRG